MSLSALAACGEDKPAEDCVGAECDESVACASDTECVEGTYCGGDWTCIPDPCTAATCPRGECARGSSVCESKASCTESTEIEDCITGERCVEGACVSEDEFCAALDCQRGVCDFDDKACASPQNCAGDDAKCLEGEFCNALDQCVPNICDINEVECPDGGVCVPALGVCQNASPCAGSAECMEGHICVLDSEAKSGICTLEQAACGDGPGDAGCVGNQLCEYDATTLEATCVEADTCTNAVDCSGARQCNGRTCVEPTACVNDALEPNDTDAEASIFSEIALADGLNATICSGDTDVYVVDTAALNSGTLRGSLIVRLDYPARAVGLGELTIELFESSGTGAGTLVAESTSGSTGVLGFAQASVELSAASEDVYFVHITDGGDVLTSGVSYTLSASFLPSETGDICTNATPIYPQQTLSGDTRQSTSTALGSLCTGLHNESAEDVYAFEVPAPSMVRIEVRPEIEDSDVSVSVREACAQIASEKACADATQAGPETLEVLLSPGTYYAIVQSPEGATDGAYQISLTMSLARCSPAGNYCESDEVAMVCNAVGGDFEAKTCATGCNPRTGECVRHPGDQCITSAVQTDDFTATINWAEYRNDYEFGVEGCVPGVVAPAPPGEEPGPGDTHTDGPDAVWTLQVPPASAISATLEMAEGEHGSLYIYEDCLFPNRSCLGAANTDQSSESLGWANETDATKTVFLVADARAPAEDSEDQTLTSATLNVAFETVICSPGTLQCDGDAVDICNEQGTEFVLNESCTFGCTQGVCNPPTNQTCSAAVALVDGATVTQRIDPYHNDYFFDPDNYTCAGEDVAATGPEAVYSITTTEANQVVSVQVQAPFDAILYATHGCAASSEPRCFAGSTSGVMSFAAPEPGTYFIYVDSADTSASGAFEITATTQTPSCVPGTIVGCNDSRSIEYCDASGASQTHYCASGTCTAGVCDTASGKICQDPILLRDGDTITDALSGPSKFQWLPNRSGRCAVDDNNYTDGPEHYYRVDLQAGELLTVDLSTSDVDDIIGFLFENCAAPEMSCRANTKEMAGSQKLQYYAETDGSVYVLVDSTATDDGQQYTISANISRGSVCAPGQSRCVDADTMEMCNHDGSAYLAQKTCTVGCANGVCNIDIPAANTCATAPNVGDGIIVYGDFEDYSNDIEISEDGCVGEKTDGPELVYAVDLLADEVLTARMTSQGDESVLLYIIDDCAAPETSCRAAGPYGNSDRNYTTSLRYASDTAQTVYLVADSTVSSYDQSFTLEIGVRPTECTAGETSCLDADTRRFCDQGLWREETCYYGEGCDLYSGQCAPASHDTCQAAVAIPADGQLHSYKVRPSDFTNLYDVDGAASCMDSAYTDSPGPEAVYSVEANLGDIITASLSGKQPVLWMSSTCDTPKNSCLAGEYKYNGTAGFSYKVLADGTYYLMADVASTSAYMDALMTLDVTVQPPECSLGQTQCGADANTLQVCDNMGLWTYQSCGFGCSAGACNLPPNDTCETARVVPADGTWQVSTHPIDLYTNQAELAADCGLVPDHDTDGPDAFYAVDLQAGEVLEAVWDHGSAYDPVWIVDDCTGLAQATSCLAGSQRKEPIRAAFTAPTAGRYYIIGDTNTDGDDGEVTMSIRAGTPACDPATYAWTCNQGGVQYCQSPGFFSTYTCQAGTCNAGQCTQPTSDNVFESEDITAAASGPAGLVRTGIWGDFENDIEGDFCTLSKSETDGHDAIYTVQLQAGQTLQASLKLNDTGSWSNDPSIYLLDSAMDPATATCLAGAHVKDAPATISYTATAAGAYHLVAGSSSTLGSTEEFELSVLIQ